MDIIVDTNAIVCTHCNHWHQLFIDGAIDECTGRCELYNEWRFRLEGCDFFSHLGETPPPRVVIHTAEYIAEQAKISTRQIKAQVKRKATPYYKLHKVSENEGSEG